jgi:hypothetical protein
MTARHRGRCNGCGPAIYALSLGPPTSRRGAPDSNIMPVAIATSSARLKPDLVSHQRTYWRRSSGVRSILACPPEFRPAISAQCPQRRQHAYHQRIGEFEHRQCLRGAGMFHAIRSSSAIRAASWAVACPGASGEISWAGTAASESVKRPVSPSSRGRCRMPDLAWLLWSVLRMAQKCLGLKHRKPHATKKDGSSNALPVRTLEEGREPRQPPGAEAL